MHEIGIEEKGLETLEKPEKEEDRWMDGNPAMYYFFIYPVLWPHQDRAGTKICRRLSTTLKPHLGKRWLLAVFSTWRGRQDQGIPGL